MGPVSGQPAKNERVAFVTGKLAEFSLRRTLDGLGSAASIDPTVAVLPISVAALMTPPWVAAHLKLAEPHDRVVLPGHCRGDLAAVEEAAGAPAVLGPKDLRDLPAWLLHGTLPAADRGPPEGYGAHSIEILAEINHANRLTPEALLASAERYRKDGADVIDLGCEPGTIWRGLGDAVRRLRDAGFRVSADTVEPEEIQIAARAGAELILSVSGAAIDVARDLGCDVVVIPDRPSSLDGLDESVAKLKAWGVRFRIDPVLEPIGFGFAASLGRFLDVRRRFSEAEILMGVGNLTELTDADSAGINVLLAGFCEEIGIRSVLTTQVIPWARTSVKELDLARRLVHHAVKNRALPKHVEEGLLLLRDGRAGEHGAEVLVRLALELKDPSVRIFAEGGLIHAMSSRFHLTGADPFEVFEEMAARDPEILRDPSHVFYLGFEMQKALTALTLGKEYRQDEGLRWGFLTREEAGHVKRRRKPGEAGP